MNSPKPKPSSRSELKAAEYLIRQGWSFIAHDLRIARVQVDLLMRNPAGLLTIIEVKSRSPMAHLSRAQFHRLRRVAATLASHEAVQLNLIIIGEREIAVLPVDALTV